MDWLFKSCIKWKRMTLESFELTINWNVSYRFKHVLAQCLFPVFAAALNLNQFTLHLFGSISFFDLSTPMSLTEIAHQSYVLTITNPQHRDVNELFYVNILHDEELAHFFFFSMMSIFDVLSNIIWITMLSHVAATHVNWQVLSFINSKVNKFFPSIEDNCYFIFLRLSLSGYWHFTVNAIGKALNLISS